MKKGNKKNSIVDRAKSNIVKNRKKNINRLNKIYDFLNTFEGRFTTIVFFTIIGFIVITANLYKIQIIQGNKWRAAGEEKYSSKNYIKANTISSKIAKDVFEILLSENKDPEIIVKEKGLVQITDNSEIEKIVEQVLAENPQSVEDYKAGKSNALKYLVGQSMRLSKGKANPKMINEMILARLEG